MSARGVRSYLDMHPLGFSELYPDRQVNNIYLDTPELDLFTENVHGDAERKKYRIRWYGEDLTVAKDPVLEIKRKLNELGDKVLQPLEHDLDLKNNRIIREYIEEHCRTGLDLGPVLMNSYKRSYLTSFDGRFRATIDWDLRFHSLNYPMLEPDMFAKDDAVILEVKYEREFDNEWKKCSGNIPFRVGKNSKYVIGVQMTN